MGICIVLDFVTSSDSASFVVDILAANGMQDPPLVQKIFWAFTEGAAAAALLASAADNPNPEAALEAVKALPIILGLPYTFLLFWMCQGLLIVCQEEAGDLSITRKNFSVFLINFEPTSFLAIVFPFVPLGEVAAKTWNGSRLFYSVAYGAVWTALIVFICLSAVDSAFGTMAISTYFIMGLGVAGLRVATRNKLGITGDMISDACVCCFAFPFAVGQLAAESFELVVNEQKELQSLEPENTGETEQLKEGEVNI